MRLIKFGKFLRLIWWIGPQRSTFISKKFCIKTWSRTSWDTLTKIVEQSDTPCKTFSKAYLFLKRSKYSDWHHEIGHRWLMWWLCNIFFTNSIKIEIELKMCCLGFWSLQGLFVPFACVGSGDPVRVLRLYTTNTLDTLWSIYCWDICTTCRYPSYVLLYWLIHSHWLTPWFWLRTVLCGAIYSGLCRR